jgi:hypothetical protein
LVLEALVCHLNLPLGEVLLLMVEILNFIQLHKVIQVLREFAQ